MEADKILSEVETNQVDVGALCKPPSACDNARQCECCRMIERPNKGFPGLPRAETPARVELEADCSGASLAVSSLANRSSLVRANYRRVRSPKPILNAAHKWTLQGTSRKTAASPNFIGLVPVRSRDLGTQDDDFGLCSLERTADMIRHDQRLHDIIFRLRIACLSTYGQQMDHLARSNWKTLFILRQSSCQVCRLVGLVRARRPFSFPFSFSSSATKDDVRSSSGEDLRSLYCAHYIPSLRPMGANIREPVSSELRRIGRKGRRARNRANYERMLRNKEAHKEAD